MEQRTTHGRRDRSLGFTLVELVVTVGVAGLLAGLAGTQYLAYVEKARVARTVAELRGIAQLLDSFELDGTGSPPATLSAAGITVGKDPWGHPYRYLRIAGGLPSGIASTARSLPSVSAPPAGGQGGGTQPAIAQARKDRFLVPINSDYDLYSVGRDGLSNPSLNNPASYDDVIRAADGSYYGLAENF